MITAQDVWERFEYNPLTGQLFYKNKLAGSQRKDGYIRIQIKGRCHYAHRIVWLWRTGNSPALLIDHINGCRNDNRLSNLRTADYLINNQNRSDNPGVCYVHNRKKFRAYITRNGVYNHIGFYQTKEDALNARHKYEASHSSS